MPSWGEILAELNALQKDLKERKGNPKTAFDTVRRKYLASLQKLTGRNVTVCPLTDSVAFQNPVIACPAGRITVTVQLLIVLDPVLVTRDG